MDDFVAQANQKFQKILEVVKQDLATIRTGKATPALIENIVAEAYGTKMKLVELATITSPDSKTLIVTPFDNSNSAGIAKAIQDANLGLTANIEDTHIRVIVPPLSQERREEFVKLAKAKIEGGKVMIRQARHEAMEHISKSTLDEDSQKRFEKEVQTNVDANTEKLDTLLTEKEKELTTI